MPNFGFDASISSPAPVGTVLFVADEMGWGKCCTARGQDCIRCKIKKLKITLYAKKKEEKKLQTIYSALS